MLATAIALPPQTGALEIGLAFRLAREEGPASRNGGK
jgi:hypothetical protein